MAGTFWRVTRQRERAKKHIREAKELLEAFADRKPYPLRFKTKTDGGYRLVEVRMTTQEEPPVLELSEAVSDAVHNLRVTLDHLVWELSAKKLGYRPQEVRLDHPLRRVAFPIYLEPTAFEPPPRKPRKQKPGVVAKLGGARDMLQFVTKDQYARIKALQPFGQPESALWLLAELDNLSKHRHAHLFTRFHRFEFAPRPWVDLRIVVERKHKGGTVQDNALVARVRANGPGDVAAIERVVDMSLKRPVFIQFGKGSPAEGQEVLAVLRRLQGRVTAVTNKFRGDFLA